MKKKTNNSHNAAALLLGITPDKLTKLMDLELDLSICQRDKEQIANMYKSLYDRFEILESNYNKLKEQYGR